VVRQLQPSRWASVIISQAHCYRPIDYTVVPAAKETSSTRLWWYPHPHRWNNEFTALVYLILRPQWYKTNWVFTKNQPLYYFSRASTILATIYQQLMQQTPTIQKSFKTYYIAVKTCRSSRHPSLEVSTYRPLYNNTFHRSLGHMCTRSLHHRYHVYT